MGQEFEKSKNPNANQYVSYLSEYFEFDKGARLDHRLGGVIQGRECVFIGDYVEIGPNSMINSGNQDVYD